MPTAVVGERLPRRDNLTFQSSAIEEEIALALELEVDCIVGPVDSRISADAEREPGLVESEWCLIIGAQESASHSPACCSTKPAKRALAR
jgi:hypothetical protein